MTTNLTQKDLHDVCSESFLPYRIDIVLDSECNLSCIGCIRILNKKCNNIDYCQFIKSIMLQENKESYELHFTGGEPFLKWNMIKEIIDEVKLFVSNITYSIYSNLTLLTDDMIHYIKLNSIQLHTSLDGLKNNNDVIRGIGTYEKITSNIQRLNNNNIEIQSITTTAKNENINSLSSDFIFLLSTLNIKKWRLNIDYHGINILESEVIDKIFELYTCAIAHNLLVEGTWMYPFNNLVSDNTEGFCSASRGNTIAILPNGKLSLCPYIETLSSSYFDDWMETEKEYCLLKMKLNDVVQCDQCIIKNYCKTQCLITRSQNDKKLFNWYCNVYRGLTVRLLEFYITKLK